MPGRPALRCVTPGVHGRSRRSALVIRVLRAVSTPLFVCHILKLPRHRALPLRMSHQAPPAARQMRWMAPLWPPSAWGLDWRGSHPSSPSRLDTQHCTLPAHLGPHIGPGPGHVLTATNDKGGHDRWRRVALAHVFISTNFPSSCDRRRPGCPSIILSPLAHKP